MLAFKHAFQFSGAHLVGEMLENLGNFPLGRGIFFAHGQLKKEFGLFQGFPVMLPSFNDILERTLFLLDLLGPVGIIPEAGVEGELIELF
jgi:hypothetical protein